MDSFGMAGLLTVAAVCGAGGFGGLGLAAGLSRRRLTGGERVVLFFIWAPLWTAIAALALAHIGVFSGATLSAAAGIWVLAGVWGLWRARGRAADPAPSACGEGTGWFWAGWLAVLAVTGVLIVPGNRYLGGWDTGVYAGVACEIGRTGALEVRDGLLPELGEAEREAFMHERTPPRQAWHAGFLITDASAGRLMPEFYHLYPAWLAVWARTGGLAGVWAGHAAISLGALGMVMLAGAGLFGRRAALLGGAALALCAAQAYAMRSTTAEMITQFCLFAGFWALDRALRGGRAAAGLAWTAAAAWAGALLAHGTALLPVGAGLAFLLAHALAGRADRVRWALLAVMAAGAAAAVAWNAARADVMTRFLFDLAAAHPGWWGGAAVLGVLTLVLSARAARGWQARAWPDRVARLGPAALAAAAWAVGLARPWLAPGVEAGNARMFLLLAGGLGVPLAVGFPVARRFRDWTAGQRLFVFVGVSTVLVLVTNKMAKLFYLWGARRWVELALPFVLLLAAATLFRLGAGVGAGWRVWARRWGAAGLAAAWLGWLAADVRVVYATREYTGTPGRLARAAAVMREADRILCDHWDAAAVWRYVHGLPAWGMARLDQAVGVADAQAAAALMRRWVAQGERVFWAGPWFADPVLRLTEAGWFEAEDAFLERRRDRLPRRALPDTRRTVLYAVSAAGGEPGDRVAMGYSAMGLVKGFSGLRLDWGEGGRRIPYRRVIGGRGRFYAPAVPGAWRVWLANHHPGRDPLPVKLWANGELAAEWEVGRDWSDYAFEMPAGDGAVLLELRSPIFKSGRTRVGVAVAELERVAE